ncbi:MAG: MBL fold metallo-hydrolase [Candidatus Marinimicrobia bacterium]|nr:MBL fold metallo-hydrolase [Candidatus Neomarinimicrobiota bacterium]
MNIRLNKSLKRTGKIIISLLLILTGSVFTINTVFSAAKYDQGDNPLKKIQASPQYKDGKFTNPKVLEMNPGFGMIKKYLFGKEQRSPEEILPQNKIDLTLLESADSSYLKVTNAGHSSLLIHMDGYRILTDPVYEAKLTPVGPTRFNKDIPIDPTELKNIDVVVISHNHYDHLNKYSIKTIHPEVARFIVPLGVGAQLEKWGVPREKITELDWWDSFDYDEKLTITSTPSQHFSGRGLADRNETLWTSYVIASLDHNIYFSGDSGYFDGFKTIGEKYGPFDIAFMECGAYNKEWADVHMFPEQTVQASLDLKAHYVWPIHWGTFNLALHDWFDPMKRVTIAAEANGVRLLTPIFGQVVEYPGRMQTKKWWAPYLPERPTVMDVEPNAQIDTP